MSATELFIRDTLDAAVRSLAISTDGLNDRLYAAGTILLSALSRTDFAESEDRELFDQIRTALERLTPAGGRDALTTSVQAMSEVMAEQVASEILDLRDTAIGRAIYRRSRTEGRRGQCNRPVP
ncbi:MAG: hypothetical protein ACYDHT_13295 [Solirubrobacteraceae bacterium]